MTVKHWAWILAGLLCWAALLITLWVTTPTGCQPPDTHHHVRCSG